MNLLLDANVLLNGVFNPFSFSAKVLQEVRNETVRGYVLDHNISEAIDRIRAVEQSTGIELESSFLLYIHALNLNVSIPASDDDIDKFLSIGGKKDAPAAAVAVRDGLSVCTHDADFMSKQAAELGIKVLDPATAVLAARGYEVKLDMYFPGFLVTPSEGAFYIHAATSWGDFINIENRDELWCILDAPSVGGLYLDISKGGLRYFVDNGPEVFVSLKGFPTGQQSLKAVVSYNSQSGVGIYMGHGQPRHWKEATWEPADRRPKSRITFWRGRRGDFGAMTLTRRIAGFAKSTSEKASNNLLSGNHPALPSERLELEELVTRFYC